MYFEIYQEQHGPTFAIVPIFQAVFSGVIAGLFRLEHCRPFG